MLRNINQQNMEKENVDSNLKRQTIPETARCDNQNIHNNIDIVLRCYVRSNCVTWKACKKANVKEIESI